MLVRRLNFAAYWVAFCPAFIMFGALPMLQCSWRSSFAIRYVTRAAHSWGFGGLFGFWPCLGHSDATFCASGCLREDPDVTFVTSGCLQGHHDVTFTTSGCLAEHLDVTCVTSGCFWVPPLPSVAVWGLSHSIFYLRVVVCFSGYFRGLAPTAFQMLSPATRQSAG